MEAFCPTDVGSGPGPLPLPASLTIVAYGRPGGGAGRCRPYYALRRELRREEQALADRGAHRILAERLGDQEGRLDPPAGEQPFGKGGDEDRRHRRDRENVLHRIDARRYVDRLDIGEDVADRKSTRLNSSH